MPYEPLEAIIEKMKADSVFRTELMAKDDVAERIELIFSEMLCCALEELQQSDMEMDEESALLGVKGSSPQSSGYAHPSKAIEKRFQ
jgi:hypothetical protein